MERSPRWPGPGPDAERDGAAERAAGGDRAAPARGDGHREERAAEQRAGAGAADGHGAGQVERVAVTGAAAELIRRLTRQHGPLMFHQSGGCCDGSAPMCYGRGEFRTGASDVLLQELAVAGLAEPVPFWMSASQYALWRHTHLTVDVVPGRGSGFSLEAPEGVRFLIRSRLLADDAAGEGDRPARRTG